MNVKLPVYEPSWLMPCAFLQVFSDALWPHKAFHYKKVETNSDKQCARDRQAAKMIPVCADRQRGNKTHRSFGKFFTNYREKVFGEKTEAEII